MFLIKNEADKEKLIAAVDALTQSLGVKVERSLADHLASRTKSQYTSIATLEGKKVVFRVAWGDHYPQIVARETTIYEIAEQNGLDYFPRLVQSGHTPDLTWLVYEYLEGEPVGTTYQFDSGSGYAPILRSLFDLQKILKDAPASLFEDKNKPELWHKLLTRLREKAQVLADPDFEIEKYLKLAEAKLSQITSKALCHGDFHPQNIIVQGAELKIIDWETSCLNSFALDYSFIWIRSFDSPARAQIWAKLEETGVAEAEANLVFLISLLRDYCEWRLALIGKNELLSEKTIINEAKPEAILADLKQNLDLFCDKVEKSS